MPEALPVVTVHMPAKPWWKSRTLWLNALVLVLAAVEAQLGLLQPLVPVNIYALVAFGLPVLNALVRVVTVQALAASSTTSKPVEPQA